MIQPATKSYEIGESIGTLLNSTAKWIDPASMEYKRVERSINELMRVNAAEGSIRMMDLASLSGDLQRVEYWLKNARQLHTLEAGIQIADMTASGNLGYFSRAAQAYALAVTVPNANLTSLFSFGLICGALNAMLNNIDARQRAQLDWGPENDRAAGLAQEASAVLHRLGLSDQHVQAMLDTAGEVLREEHEFWMDSAPVIRVVNTPEDVGLLYQFHVAGSAERACELTDRVVDRLIERDADRIGLSFSFLPWAEPSHS